MAAGVALLAAPVFAANKDILIAPTGTTYEVWELRERTFLGDSTSGSSVLRYAVIELDSRHEGVVNGTDDGALDTQPRLALDPSTNEPVLVWSRWDGSHQKIAYSRYSGTQWSSPRIITFGPGDHWLPRIGAARDGEYLFWVSKGDHYMYAPLNLSTGALISSARQIKPSYAHGRDKGPAPMREPGYTIQGGSDAPIITRKPKSTGKTKSELWAVASGRDCRAQVVVVPSDDVQSLSIFSFHNGTIHLRTRLPVPTPIPDGYGDQAARTFLRSLCR